MFLNDVFSDVIQSFAYLYTYYSNEYLCKLTISPTGRKMQDPVPVLKS